MKNSFLSALCVFFFCLSLTVFILTWQLKMLANPTFIKTVLRDTKVYDQINKLGDNLTNQTSGDFNFVALTKTFTRSIDKNVAQQQIENFIDSFYLFLLGKSDSSSVVIDLTKIKTNFTAQWQTLAPQTFSEEYQKLPACSTQNSSNKASLNAPDANCKSTQISSADYSELIKTANISEFTKSIPDQITLQDLLKSDHSGVANIKKFLNTVFLLYTISLIMLILSLLGVVLFTWPDIRQIFTKLGWSTVVITLPTILISFTSNYSAKFLQSLTATQGSDKIAEIFIPFITILSKNIFQAIIKLPIILCISGAVILILALFMPKMEEKVIPPGFESKPV